LVIPEVKVVGIYLERLLKEHRQGVKQPMWIVKNDVGSLC
jgi:hypothetical protein